MVGKRKRNDPLTPTLRAGKGTTVETQPQKKRKKEDASAADVSHTIAQIIAFKDGVANITDWKSDAVIPRHVQVIYWFDVEVLSKDECAKRYLNKEGKPCSIANIFKVYNTYAPRFYAEKGLSYVPLGKRGAARAHQATPAGKTRKKGRKSRKGKVSPLDLQLRGFFEKLPGLTSPARRESLGQSDSISCPHRINSNTTGDGHDAEDDTVNFFCTSASATYGSPLSLRIPRASLTRHCTTIRQSLLSSPHVRAIHYTPEIDPDTISRFSACISPSLQPLLPTHVTTPYGTFEQEWSMAELEDLYVFSVTLGAGGVCDLVIDRWVEELRRSEAKLVSDESGDAQYFDIFGFGPEFLNFLMVNDEKGFEFLIDVLVSQGMAGYKLLCDTHLANWYEGVKKAFIERMEQGSVVDLFSASRETICAAFHHHGPAEQFASRLPGEPPRATTRTIAAPKALERPTLNTRSRYDDVEDTSNILRLSIPSFPHTHNKHPVTPDMDPTYRLAEHGTNRLREHRNDHMVKRIQYANPKFNAHHDTEAVCREKLRIVRDKVALFKEKWIEISDEEVARALEADNVGEDEEDEIGEDGEVDEEGESKSEKL